MKPSLKKTLLASLVVPAIALTAACTGGSSDKAGDASKSDTGAARSAPAAEPVPTAPERAEAGLEQANAFDSVASTTTALGSTAQRAGGAPDAADTPDRTEPQTQAIISKGQISLHSKDIDAARFDLQKLLDTLNGTISDEQSSANKEGKTIRQRLVLRVPTKRFGKAMDGIATLPGVKLVNRSRSSEDVTTQVIDNNARIRTQRASLARIQALLSQATNLSQVISIESQLSRRQAALDSLEAQQKYLADQTSLSTITVYLTVPSKKSTGHKDDDHNFFSGLKSGWDHLGSSTNAVLTGIGAVLPFAVLLALLGLPVWAAWRRRTVQSAPAEG